MTLGFLIGCVGISEKQIEKRAIVIAQTLDSNRVKIFYEWNYTSRGEHGYWHKENDSSLDYSCQYFMLKDTANIVVFQPYLLANDFPTTFNFDTSKYSEFTLSEFNNKVTISGSEGGRDRIIERNIILDSLFKTSNPFDKLSYLTNLKDSLKITHISYQGQIGNFIQFYLGNQHVLTYLPDNLKLDEFSRKIWEAEFKKGKMIQKNWNFRKLDAPLDNG